MERVMNELLPDEVLALTIWGEARGESIEGQVAVANVIMNRWKNNLAKYKTVTDVCLEPRQFSCWNESDPNKVKLDKLMGQISRGVVPPELKQQLYIARGVMGFNLTDNTKGSRHYITNKLYDSEQRPRWAKTPITDPIRIGNHVFFNV
jgi:spore germination cell wall hydrolase CwlJ-like protein